MANTRLVMDIRGVPEVLAEIRLEVSNAIREVALDEEPKVARRLNEIAADFEAGLAGSEAHPELPETGGEAIGDGGER